MSITIFLEIGHDASLRTKTTPEGFTHDWEVFVKGCNGADIHYFIEKVVFHLHETFPKPKRVVKEPPYSLRTSGYAGFILPIEIYLKNDQEPKRIRFSYDLDLHTTGPPIHKVQKEKYTFFNPSEEFKSKLLKGGAVAGSGGNTQDINNSRAVDEKNQMTSKPKLSGSDQMNKKHKIKPEEPRNTDFENLFGPPIKKTSKAPEPSKSKDVPKSSLGSEKLPDKDKSDKSKTKSPHKEKEKSRDKSSENSEKKKEEKRRSKDDKGKDKDRGKDKSSKKVKEKEKEKSPSLQPRPHSPSPKRSPKRAPSPPPQKHSSSKEQNKEEKRDKDKDKERSKDEKKSKKDKREHKDSKHKERDKEKDHKEHKSKESKSTKDKDKDFSNNSKTVDSNPVSSILISQQTHKTDKKVKDKEHPKEPPKEEEKPEKVRQDQSEDRQKQHKHKKKDRKEKREEKHLRNEKKSEKQPSLTTTSVKEIVKESPVPVSSTRDTDKSNLFGSPKSDPPSTPKETTEQKTENNHFNARDEESSSDSIKLSSREASPIRKAPSKSPSPVQTEPVKKPEPDKKKEESPKKKDKKERKKDKKHDKDNEKRRKRKSDSTTNVEPEQPPEKMLREEENNNSDDESKVSSTEDANPIIPPKSEYDMDMLRDLQHKIMSLKDNADLQKVVQLIAETGQYEVSAHTFDFDLCLLDTSTVRQLQEFFSTIS